METSNALDGKAWTEKTATSISVEDLDQLVKEMRKKRDIYEAAKAKSTELYKEYEQLEGAVVEALRQAGKKRYHVDGLGTATVVEKLVVTTPKTLEDKRKFFEWIKAKFGDTVLLDKQGINHQSLQKLYNDAYDEAVERGEGHLFSVPGLQPPTNYPELRFTKEK